MSNKRRYDSVPVRRPLPSGRDAGRKAKKRSPLRIFFLVLVLMLVYIKSFIPGNLVNFMGKYPEAAWFVLSYPWSHQKEWKIDVAKEMQKNRIPLFLQWDKRWGYSLYGDDFMALTGCGPTCLSMVLCGLTGDSSDHPLAVAKYADRNGYYVDGVGTAWDFMTDGAWAFGLYAEEGYADEQYIRSNLSPETPMICSMGPGDFTRSGHFIVLTGIDSEGKIILNDPNSRKNSRKHWAFSELMPQIVMVWRYSAYHSP